MAGLGTEEEAEIAKQRRENAAPDATQMHLGSGEAKAVTAEDLAAGNKGAIKSSGMNRDRTVKDAVPDEFNFADMRAGLGKKKKAAGDAPADGAAPAEGGLSRQGSKTASRKASAAALDARAGSIAAKSQLSKPPDADAEPGTPQVAPPAEAAASGRLSRKQSQASGAGAAAADAPAASMSRQPSAAAQNLSRQASAVQQALSKQGSHVSQAQQELAAALSRAGSRLSQPGGGDAGGDDGGAPLAGTVRSQAQLSRQGTAQLSRQLSQTAARSQQSMARLGSQAKVGFDATTLPPTSPGIDWQGQAKANQERADDAEKKLANAEAELATTEKKLKDANSRAEKAEKSLQASRRGSVSMSADLQELMAENERLKGRLAAGGGGDGGGGGGDSQEQVADLQAEVAKLQAQVRAGGSRRGSVQVVEKVVEKEVVKEVIPPHVEQLMHVATQEVETLRAQAEEKDAQLQTLASQLDASHEAIIAATQTGFEHDIKLHQARAALSALLKREKAAPKKEKPAAADAAPTSWPPQVDAAQLLAPRGPSPVPPPGALPADAYVGSDSPPQQAYVPSPGLQQPLLLHGLTAPASIGAPGAPRNATFSSPGVLCSPPRPSYDGRLQTPGGMLQTPELT